MNFFIRLTGKPALYDDENNPDWIPTVNMGYKRSHSGSEADLIRFKRYKGRCEKKVLTDLENQQEKNAENFEGNINPSKLSKDTKNKKGIATETTFEDINKWEEAYEKVPALEKKIVDLEKENDSLRRELTARNEELFQLRDKVDRLMLGEKTIRKNSDMIRYYTGLPNINVFFVVLNAVSVHLNQNCALTPYHQFLITLMKLRLNVSFQGLAYRFDMSRKAMSTIFHNTLDILYKSFSNFIYWPDREALRKTIPTCFKRHFKNNIAVIIDCFEVFIKRPSNLKAKAETWSNYKHRQTVKYLLGITPQGVICFISDGYGGRSSDKHVTLDSGILDNLLPGDVVLADRGFTIDDDVSLHYATLQMPAFTKGLSQLLPFDIERTRKIASVRIHVERVIANIRLKYKIMSGPIPIEMLIGNGGECTLDKITRVCCALINLCPSVVPLV